MSSPCCNSSLSGDVPPKGDVVQAHRGLRGLVLLPSRALVALLLGLIAIYQRFVSPSLGPCCRFEPSCSSYAAEALRKYGLLRGVARASWRVLRCNPFCRGGHDPP